MYNRNRAQSELVGNILLIGVVVIVASTVALGIVGNINNQTGINGDQPSQVDLIADTTADNLTLAHNGGDSLQANEVTVRLSNGTTEKQFKIDTANLTGSDDRFDPGERFERAHGLNGTYIDVLVSVERAGSSAVVLDTTVSTRSE
jgi:FlaG/FlaF family flagellin (archaellin)